MTPDITQHFASPWWGLASIAVVTAVIIACKLGLPALRIPSAEPFKRNASSKRMNPLKAPYLLEGLALLCLVVGMMRPQQGIEKRIERTEGVDIILALDVSGSMDAYDLPEEIDTRQEELEAMEKNEIEKRITIATNELTKFVENRPADRLGLIAFARYSYMLCPPTLDHDFLLQQLHNININELPDGTGLAAPITSAARRLKESDAQRRVLVLFTDGRNNVDTSVSPSQAADIAKKFNIIIYTVGIGSSRSIIRTETPFGDRLQSGLAGYNEDILKEIADKTGGRFFTAKNAEEFREVMQEIDDLEKTTIEQPYYTDYREQFVPWAIAGLAFLIAAFVLEKTILQPVP